jgi:glycine cleavage system H protein
MKDISELKFPDNIRYTKDHEWALAQANSIRAGISDYAQDQLGDVVYVELPKTGDSFQAGEVFGTVESVKAVSELFMPVSGKITGVNTSLTDNPDMVNADPYGAGWMIDIQPDAAQLPETLMTQEAYLNMLKG